MALRERGWQIDLWRNTIDLIILKAVPVGPQHSYRLSLSIRQNSGGEPVFQRGSLHPALYRLRYQVGDRPERGEIETNRRANCYRLPHQATADSRKRQKSGTALQGPSEPI